MYGKKTPGRFKLEFQGDGTVVRYKLSVMENKGETNKVVWWRESTVRYNCQLWKISVKLTNWFGGVSPL